MLDVRKYAVVTAAYWGFMLTDGALRMLVLLHFHRLGYTPFELAVLFLAYELMGIVTNAGGGWVASRFGLKLTLTGGLLLQVVALLALSALDPAWPKELSVLFVLVVQGLSGVAKDLTKMSSKSALKFVVPENETGGLYRWVALLTGSKNAIKGLGFFIGALLLSVAGFQGGLWLMAGFLAVILAGATLSVEKGMGKAKKKAKFTEIFSKSREINLLSAARVFLFGARDVWFVVGVPVFLYDQLGWTFNQVGAFMAAWVIGYGFVQAMAPKLTSRSADGLSTEVRAARIWLVLLALTVVVIIAALRLGVDPGVALIAGLALFGIVFAVNSAVHSYLILALSENDGVTLNVGFYYGANATGRLLGTLLSGISYQWAGIDGCLIVAFMFLVAATVFTSFLRDKRVLPAA
ncbi:MAG TPA: MFS transporter [Rhodospirillaceae bacterium]|nr:MFS transporter [Magnetovibrio sp.]HBT41990.1 MFS transporter [Rhodospirillaceae bacterium]HCS69120.1 MFS transporter [Rhodospirillaceae bacterium]|tara:strand:- start:906 stop:2126 length:1221 start_codon:yes stop_codon:yes gene_type:complete